jgi:hypothetical protein
MFSRSQPPSEGTPPAGTSGAAETTGGEAARAFDQVLSELHPPGAAPSDPDVASVAAKATEHAETLRATRDAQQEAQAMLAMASEARKDASEQAERIVLEARDAAERTRQELAGWAAAQRAKVDALAADMVESANRDADSIRAEALRTSMVEAEETARLYVAEAATRAQRDADATRGEARNVLHRATELGQEAAEAIRDLTTTVSDIVTRLQDARASMEQLLAEIPAVEPEDSEEPGDAEESEGSADADEAVDADETAETEAADEEDDLSDEVEEAEDADLAAEDNDPLSEEQPDRQLGSMFRRPGQRGD